MRKNINYLRERRERNISTWTDSGEVVGKHRK